MSVTSEECYWCPRFVHPGIFKHNKFRKFYLRIYEFPWCYFVQLFITFFEIFNFKSNAILNIRFADDGGCSLFSYYTPIPFSWMCRLCTIVFRLSFLFGHGIVSFISFLEFECPSFLSSRRIHMIATPVVFHFFSRLWYSNYS